MNWPGELREARAVQARHATLVDASDIEERRLREAETERDAAAFAPSSRSLCREAGVDLPDELAEAACRSADRGRLEDALRDL